MAQITVIYKDFEEMKAVARELLKDELKEKQERGEKSVPYGQQIAPHFPNANVGQTPAVPADQPATVTPGQAPASAAQSAVPTTAPSYTREDLSRAAITLMDKGQQAQLQQLVQSFGVNSLMELPPEQYGNFATALRGMGAEI